MTIDHSDLNSSHGARWLSWGLGVAMLAAVVAAVLHFSEEQAFARLRGPKALEIIPGASHLFPEPGAMEAVIRYAGSWFQRHLGSPSTVQAEGARSASVGGRDEF